MGTNHAAAAAARDPQPLRWGVNLRKNSEFESSQLSKKWRPEIESAIKKVKISTGKPPVVKFKPINYTEVAQTLGSDNARTPNPTAAPTPYSTAPSTPNPTATLQNDESPVTEVVDGMRGLTVRSFEPEKLFQN